MIKPAGELGETLYQYRILFCLQSRISQSSFKIRGKYGGVSMAVLNEHNSIVSKTLTIARLNLDLAFNSQSLQN